MRKSGVPFRISINTNKIRLIIFLLAIRIAPVSFGQVNWTKYDHNPVLSKGPGTFDILAVGQPTALLENDTIKMWYVGVSPDMKARICYAYSLDGINWIKNNTPVVDVGDKGEWDSGWLDTPGVVKDTSGFKMYYYGDTVQQSASISSAIGIATSKDGIHWEKYMNNPVLRKGNPGDWDGSWIESPVVLFDSLNGEYKMWYNGGNTTTWKVNIGLATSTDGITWSKYIGNPVLQTGTVKTYDDMWAGTPAVLEVAGRYEMWYSATSSVSFDTTTSAFDTISICYATSEDGINWNKYSGNPLFNTYAFPYDSTVDRGGPWAPTVIYNSGTNNYMMWYEANGGNSNFSFSFAVAPRTITKIAKYSFSETNISVFPNPFTTQATIQLNEEMKDASIMIINHMGQIVYAGFNNNSREFIIKRNHLPPGIYFLKIQNVEKTYTGKFIIE